VTSIPAPATLEGGRIGGGARATALRNAKSYIFGTPAADVYGDVYGGKSGAAGLSNADPEIVRMLDDMKESLIRFGGKYVLQSVILLSSVRAAANLSFV
jgi:hypothetical protein